MMTFNPNGVIAEMIDVSKVLGNERRATTVLNHVSFQANLEEVILMLGPSGSGKSTFLTTLAGLQLPTSGMVKLFGNDIQKYTRKELQLLRAAHIGFIFQNFNLIDALTAVENITLVSKFIGATRKNALSRANELMEFLGVRYLANSYPSNMSQGEKQRVAIARALVNEARLILADEPTGSLSSEQGLQIVEMLKSEAKTKNRCVIIVSHDERVASFSDRVFKIQDGKITPK